MQPITKISITDISTNGAISVLTQTYINYNGQDMLLNSHREALSPGQFDRAKEILPENQYNALESLWTPEIINTWKIEQERISKIYQKTV